MDQFKQLKTLAGNNSLDIDNNN